MDLINNDFRKLINRVVSHSAVSNLYVNETDVTFDVNITYSTETPTGPKHHADKERVHATVVDGRAVFWFKSTTIQTAINTHDVGSTVSQISCGAYAY